VARFARLILLLLLMVVTAAATAAEWQELEPGLELGSFERHDDRQVVVKVVRVDPEHWEPVLLSTSAPGEGEMHSIKEWCLTHNMVAGINASMFQTDYLTSVSLLRDRHHVNNAYVSKDNTVLAFDPLQEGLSPVVMIDRTCDDFDLLRTQYGTLVQSIRMISCRGNNVWSQQKRKYSTAAIGVDSQGRLLLIHCRKPLPTHDMIALLQAMPLDLERCMYVEGGPEAQLFVHAGDKQIEFVGSFETGFFESDLNRTGWPVPNIIGIRKR
jgi:hypothetical protein